MTDSNEQQRAIEEQRRIWDEQIAKIDPWYAKTLQDRQAGKDLDSLFDAMIRNKPSSWEKLKTWFFRYILVKHQ